MDPYKMTTWDTFLPRYACMVYLLLIYLTTSISAQIEISDDFSMEASRFSRSVDDNSFVESNEILRYHKREMQHELLHLLGLEQTPRPSNLRGGKNHSAPQFMLDLYNSLSSTNDLDGDEDAMDYDVYSSYHRQALSSMLRMGNFNYTTAEVDAVDESDTIMSLPVHYRSHSIDKHGHHRYHFETNTVGSYDILSSAELRVYRDIANDLEYRGGSFKVKVFQISEDRRLFMDSIIIESGDVGWIVFDVSYGSQILQSYPGARLTIQLIVEDMNRQEVDPSLIGLRGVGGNEHLEPFVVAFFKTQDDEQEERIARVRRSTSRTKRVKKNKQKNRSRDTQSDPIPPALLEGSPANSGSASRRRECRKRKLYIDFAALDWSKFIIAPIGFDAWACLGECSFPLHGKLNATNHAIVQTLVHHINTNIPRASCAPTKLGNLQVLYFDDGANVILRKYKNMVVRNCGCH